MTGLNVKRFVVREVEGGNQWGIILPESIDQPSEMAVDGLISHR